MAHTQIATIMIAQLGGAAFVMRTGATSFDSFENQLSFRIGKNEKNIAAVRITLTPDDLYTLEFFKPGTAETGYKPIVVDTREGIYNDSLVDVFDRVTGLRTRP